MSIILPAFSNANRAAGGVGPRVLPLPAVLDSGTAVLLHLLLAENDPRPVILDAAALREISSVGAMLLASTLRMHCGSEVAPRILNLSYPLRLELSRHPLSTFLADPSAAGPALRINASGATAGG